MVANLLNYAWVILIDLCICIPIEDTLALFGKNSSLTRIKSIDGSIDAHIVVNVYSHRPFIATYNRLFIEDDLIQSFDLLHKFGFSSSFPWQVPNEKLDALEYVQGKQVTKADVLHHCVGHVEQKDIEHERLQSRQRL